MTFAIGLLTLLDAYDTLADKVRLPGEETQREWANKSETHRKIVTFVTERRGWAKAFRTIHEKLGLLPEDADIQVVLEDSEERHLANAAGKNGRGTIRFNLKQIVPLKKKLDDIEIEMRSGKLAPWIVPPQRLDVLIVHELTHIVCGTREGAWLSEGLATYAAGEDKLRTIASEVLGRTWDEILRREKTWSAEYIARFKPNK